MLSRGIAKLFVPAGKLELFTGGEGEGTREVDGVVGTQRMSACAVGGFREKRVVDGVTIDPPPEPLQIIDRVAELGRGQATALAHPAQGRGCLHMRDCGSSDAVGVVVGTPRLLGARLVDQKLDQGAGIQVEAQRRPSET